MISQYNTIKVTLLIYRICWKIEEKQIYSLITKCSLLQSYLINSLSRYFELQNNILMLRKFMSEPILHLTERKDSLDIMYEMNMKELLQHPVVVEVINLVYEGEYSISSSPLSLSRTYLCATEMEMFNQKSICKRMIANIAQFGDSDTKKQSSLMFNIWKQSIQQREQDEMVFTILINVIIITLSSVVSTVHNDSHSLAAELLGIERLASEFETLHTFNSTLQTEFCSRETELIFHEQDIMGYFTIVMVTLFIGTVVSVTQRLLTYRFKDNVTLDVWHVLLELSISINCLFFFQYGTSLQKEHDTRLSDFCGDFVDLTPD